MNTSKFLKILLIFFLVFQLQGCQDNAPAGADSNRNANNKSKVPNEFKISKTELLNKIKGGWSGQVIGCQLPGL